MKKEDIKDGLAVNYYPLIQKNEKGQAIKSGKIVTSIIGEPFQFLKGSEYVVYVIGVRKFVQISHLEKSK